MKPIFGVSYNTKQIFALELADQPVLQYRTPQGELLDGSDELRTDRIPLNVTWSYHGLSNGRELFRHNGGNILQAIS